MYCKNCLAVRFAGRKPTAAAGLFFFFQRRQLQHPPVVEERGKCALEMRSIRFDSGNDTFHRIESIQSNRQSPTSPKSSEQHKLKYHHRRRRGVHRQQCVDVVVTFIIACAVVLSKRIAIATAHVAEGIANIATYSSSSHISSS